MFINYSNLKYLFSLLSGRFDYYIYLINDYSIVNILLGKTIKGNYILDQSYITLFANGGILAIIIFYFLYFKFIKNNIFKQGYIFTIVVVILISGFFENYFSHITSASFPLFWLIFYKSAYIKNNYN
jgi:hypothetical protein